MKHGLSLAFSPHGRTGRAAFWVAYLAQNLAAVAFIAFAATMIDSDDADPSLGVMAVSGALFAIYVLCVVAGMMHGIRRFHDRGKSGWWTLVGFIPIVGGPWYLAEVGGLRGNTGDNRYGPDPRRVSSR